MTEEGFLMMKCTIPVTSFGGSEAKQGSQQPPKSKVLAMRKEISHGKVARMTFSSRCLLSVCVCVYVCTCTYICVSKHVVP